MIVIRYNKLTSEKKKVEYPRFDMGKIIGLDENIEFYEIKELEKPEFNPNQYELKEKIILTENISQNYSHLKIAKIEWILIEYSKNHIIKKLNDSFGNYIDNIYPIWQRIKDINLSTVDSDLRKQNESDLRLKREKRENEFINNNIFPNFTWDI